MDKIIGGGDLDILVDRLQKVCERGLVVDVNLRDGRFAAGVAGAVSREGFILEDWDEQSHGPSGHPRVIVLSDICQVRIP